MTLKFAISILTFSPPDLYNLVYTLKGSLDFLEKGKAKLFESTQ